MRRSKVVVVLDLDIEDNFCDQDIADVFNQVLGYVEEVEINNLIIFEKKEHDEVEDLIKHIRNEL